MIYVYFILDDKLRIYVVSVECSVVLANNFKIKS